MSLLFILHGWIPSGQTACVSVYKECYNKHQCPPPKFTWISMSPILFHPSAHFFLSLFSIGHFKANTPTTHDFTHKSLSYIYNFVNVHQYTYKTEMLQNEISHNFPFLIVYSRHFSHVFKHSSKIIILMPS